MKKILFMLILVFIFSISSYAIDFQSGFTQDTLAFKGMASITILPTIFSTFLNIEETLIFKIIFPVIFSLVPIGLYQLYHPHWGKKVAFISCILFIVSFEFYNLLPIMPRLVVKLARLHLL